jgi:hypothetical protein
VRLASPIGGATDGSGNLSTSLSNVAKQAAHPKFVWVFNANCDGTIIYNDPVLLIEKFSRNEIYVSFKKNRCSSSFIVIFFYTISDSLKMYFIYSKCFGYGLSNSRSLKTYD